jgi:hypothetical protein
MVAAEAGQRQDPCSTHAFFMSATTFASSVGANSFRAKAAGVFARSPVAGLVSRTGSSSRARAACRGASAQRRV